jgi:serine/threonine-protein kinase
MHPMIGKELGNYVVRSLLGEGGMGAVFAGEHRFLGDKVAIKVLHGSFANNENVTERFFREAKSTREIKHPGVISIIDFGKDTDGSLYLVMELLEGQSLQQALMAPFAEATTRDIGAQIADALAAAHAKGIVHRDLKPDNVFLTHERVKILDFGIAKVMTSAAGTKTGSLLGTPMFMAPEQAKAAKVIGPPVDIYALGAILYNMVCGRPPFEGDLTQLLTAHLFEQPVKPSERGFEITPELETLIMQCLEKEPEARPQKMMEVRDALTGTTGVAYKSEPGAFRSPTAQQSAISGSQPGTVRSPTAARPAATASRSSVGSSQAGTAPTLGQAMGTQSTLAAAAAEKVDAPVLPAKKNPLKIVLPAAAAVIAVATVAAVLMRKPPPRTPAPVIAAAPAPKEEAKPAPLPPEVPKVHIKLKLEPADARVELDGIATTENPLELPESETTHKLVISAPGKQTVTREVRAMTSGEIFVQLPAEVAKPAVTHHAPSHKEPAAAAPATKKVRGPVETDL